MENIKYIVNVHVNKVDDLGKIESESFDYEFRNELPILARIEAIEKVKMLNSFFSDEQPEGYEFSSFSDAEKKNFKGFRSYSIHLNFVNEDGDFSPIYGCDKEEQLDWLEYEAQVFKDFPFESKYITVTNPNGEEIKVLENEFIFLLEN